MAKTAVDGITGHLFLNLFFDGMRRSFVELRRDFLALRKLGSFSLS